MTQGHHTLLMDILIGFINSLINGFVNYFSGLINKSNQFNKLLYCLLNYYIVY